ncbi:hypothetical protein [Kitasatospora sp. NPDC004272]
MPTAHDKAAVIEMAASGATTADIVRALPLGRDTVRRIRNTTGHPAAPARTQPLTLEEAWKARTRPVDNGHLEWTGSCHHSGTPVMRYSGERYTAARIAYRIEHGTDPVGRAVPACGRAHCVAPAHLADSAAGRPQASPGARYATVEEKLAALTRPLEGDHTQWTGPVKSDGTLMLPWRGRCLMPPRLVFAAHYGREPQGHVTVACGIPHCLTGSHLDDALTRAAHRAAYAALGL